MAYFAVDVTRGSQSPDHEALIPHLIHALAEQLGRAKERGRVSSTVDTTLEADALATMAAGLLTGMLVNYYDTDHATRIVDYRLAQLFTGP
ncbi:hypothetical protein V5P93_001696 [Actinokineospora auranticolor]|uniref:TetR family transcriptional regulator n=1 Tax=Actinokineospora auranticolor TaxID=155976 RepID=A0A2S6GGG2_9PSEU|nr:hypothetical protein [Actinokineospora auranticolor]PPK64299.1 hypothetical protein CLV40_12020 [Actinokineospora auranticolor]